MIIPLFLSGYLIGPEGIDIFAPLELGLSLSVIVTVAVPVRDLCHGDQNACPTRRIGLPEDHRLFKQHRSAPAWWAVLFCSVYTHPYGYRGKGVVSYL